MSVAENAPATMERTPRGAQQLLAVGSLLGAVYVLASLWVVLAGLPLAWNAAIHNAEGKPYYNNEYLFATLLLMICSLAAVALGYIGYQLLRNQEIRGLRTGILFAALMLFASLWIAEAAGNAFEEKLFDPAVGLIGAGLIGAVLIGGTVFLFLQPFWGRILETAEDQGWFHATAFKASQGVRVRRGTVVGVLTLGICGIYTLVTHRTFGFEAPGLAANDWFWKVPFTGETEEQHFIIPLIYKIHLVMPVLLSLVLLVFAWRLVNVPAFADFLIATEAEINKVSWTTRRRLIQDTIVVLVTVLLMTLFLFAVDILWVLILRYQYVGVLYYDPREVQQKQQEKNQW